MLGHKRFSPRHPPLFEAAMTGRYARSDVRDSDTTYVDIKTCHHLVLNCSRQPSRSLLSAVMPRGRRLRMVLERRGRGTIRGRGILNRKPPIEP